MDLDVSICTKCSSLSSSNALLDSTVATQVNKMKNFRDPSCVAKWGYDIH